MKKIISLVIALSLVITMFASVTAFAAVQELSNGKTTVKINSKAVNEYTLTGTTSATPQYGVYFDLYSTRPSATRYCVLEGEIDLKVDVNYFNTMMYAGGTEIRAFGPYAAGTYSYKFIYDITGKAGYVYIDNKLAGACINWTNSFSYIQFRTGLAAAMNGVEIHTINWRQRFFADCSLAELASSLGLTAGTAVYDSVSKEYTLSHNITQVRTGAAIGSLAKFNANSSNNNFKEEATTFIYVAGYDSSDKMIFAKKVPYDYNGGQSATVACDEKADYVKMFLLYGANLVPLTEQLAVENL